MTRNMQIDPHERLDVRFIQGTKKGFVPYKKSYLFFHLSLIPLQVPYQGIACLSFMSCMFLWVGTSDYGLVHQGKRGPLACHESNSWNWPSALTSQGGNFGNLPMAPTSQGVILGIFAWPQWARGRFCESATWPTRGHFAFSPKQAGPLN